MVSLRLRRLLDAPAQTRYHSHRKKCSVISVNSMLQHLLDPKVLIVTAPVFLFSLSMHEFMHAWMATRLGDPTPHYHGRLTLNPFAHYDPIGTTMGLLFRMFGWAKPVPVNTSAFKWPKRDMMLTALGGPAINAVLAICFILVFKILQLDFFEPGTLGWGRPAVELIEKMAAYGVFINLALGLFNLIPLYPLDGHHILRGFLSFKAALAYDKTKHAGGYVLVALIILSFSARISIIGAPVFFIINLAFTNAELSKLNQVFNQLF